MILATMLQDLNDTLADHLFAAGPGSVDRGTVERIVAGREMGHRTTTRPARRRRDAARRHDLLRVSDANGP